jgi:hypothetical protein
MQMQSLIFFHTLPLLSAWAEKNRETGDYHSSHDQSWSYSSCQIHTVSKFLFRSDLGLFCYFHPITYNTPDNRDLLKKVLFFVDRLTSSPAWGVRRTRPIRFTLYDMSVKMAWVCMPTTLASLFASMVAIDCTWHLYWRTKRITFLAHLVKKGR